MAYFGIILTKRNVWFGHFPKGVEWEKERITFSTGSFEKKISPLKHFRPWKNKCDRSGGFPCGMWGLRPWLSFSEGHLINAASGCSASRAGPCHCAGQPLKDKNCNPNLCKDLNRQGPKLHERKEKHNQHLGYWKKSTHGVGISAQAWSSVGVEILQVPCLAGSENQSWGLAWTSSGRWKMEDGVKLVKYFGYKCEIRGLLFWKNLKGLIKT